ncbi:MAG: T9SS type A sorting domain-containing protein [Bacteroidota bacterium]
MDLRKLFALFFSFWCIIVFAQQQEVISPLGKSYNNNTGSISFTLGEFMNNTFSSPDLILTQGFHQSKIVVVGNQPLLHQGIEILAYPNPVKAYVILKIEKYQDFSYMLIDMTGKIIEKREVVSTETEINFNYLEPSLYVLKVLWKEEDVRSFKITKN